MAGWNDIRQPHDPWDDEDLSPLRLASELLGIIQPPNDPAVRTAKTLFSVGPNVLNQLNRVGSPGEIPVWEQGLNYGDVMRQAGHEGWVADALGLVGDLAEPGPGEFATVAKWAPAIAAMGPRFSVDSRMVADLAHRLRGAKRPPVFGDALEEFTELTRVLDDPEVYGAAPRMTPRMLSVEDAAGQLGYQPWEIQQLVESQGIEVVSDMLRDQMPRGYEEEITQYLRSFRR